MAGRLVCVDFLHPRPGRPGGLRFLFDCGDVTAAARDALVLQAAEIEDPRWAGRDEADRLLSGPVGRRVARALEATATALPGGRAPGRRGRRLRPGQAPAGTRAPTNRSTGRRTRSASRAEANQASGGTRSATGYTSTRDPAASPSAQA